MRRCATVEDIWRPLPILSLTRCGFERRVPECAIVIFGANGDLTKRKLLPALYRLAHDRRLPDSFAIVGNSRTAMTDEAFRERMKESVQKFSEDTEFDPALWERFGKNIHYIAGDMNDPALYKALAEKAAATGQKNLLFYLSTQPSYYRTVVDGLAQAELNKPPAVGGASLSRSPSAMTWPARAASMPISKPSSRNARRIASIITWAKRLSRIFSVFASATASLNHCGTGATSIRFRSRRRNRSASKGAAPTIRKPARCAT